MTLELTSSEMRSWQSCRRGWYINYYRKLRRAHDLPSLPNIGTMVHGGLEAYYRGENVDPAANVKLQADDLYLQYPDYGDQISKDAEMAAIMLEGYMEWIEETGADAEFEYVASEQAVEVELEGTDMVLKGKIDARLRREADGALLQLEHKTVGNFTELPRIAQSNPQFLTYDLLAYLTKPDGVPTDGVILNMLRRVKRTARAKPPFYMRHEVRHNIHELRAHWKHVMSVGRQIQEAHVLLDSGIDHHLVCPPNVDKSHFWACSCAPITTLFDDGSDVEEALEQLYEHADPMERYAPREEENEQQ